MTEITRKAPAVQRTRLLVYLDAPYAPLNKEDKIDATRVAIKGTDAIGTSYTINCTPDCFRQITGYDSNGVKRATPMHLGPDQVRFMVRINSDDKAFRVDRFVELDQSKLDRREERPVIKVRVEQDEHGILTMYESPHNTASDVQRAILNEMSGVSSIKVGDVFASYVVAAIAGDTVELARPGQPGTAASLI